MSRREPHGERRRELWPLLLVLLAAAGLIVFVNLAGEVVEGDTAAIDRAILLGLRSPADLSDPIGPEWLERAAVDVTSLGSVTTLVIVSLIVAGFLVMDRKRGAAFLVLGSLGGGALLSTLLKEIFERNRPDVAPPLVDAFSPSFPSGHAMLSTVTYLTLGALLARVQSERRIKAYVLAVAMALSAAIGLSRVYLGVHWPTDVLAGWCIGSAWAMACWLFAIRLQKRGQVERGAPASEETG